MTKQISPEQALHLSYTLQTFRKWPDWAKIPPDVIPTTHQGKRFIRPGETQESALKRLRNSPMGKTKQGPSRRDFPVFTPGKTTTADYAAAFERMNNLVATGSAAHLTHPAPVPEGTNVEVL